MSDLCCPRRRGGFRLAWIASLLAAAGVAVPAEARFAVYEDLGSFEAGVGATTLESFESLQPHNDDTALPRLSLPGFRIDMSASDTFGVYDLPNLGAFATDGVQYLRTSEGPLSMIFLFPETQTAFAFEATDFGDVGTATLFVVAGSPQPNANKMFFGLSTPDEPFFEIRIIGSGSDAFGVDAVRFQAGGRLPVTITFDSLAHQDPVEEQFLNEGVIFDGATALQADLLGVNAQSPPIALNSSFEFRFVDPADPGTPAATDSVTLFALHVDSLANSMTAFDADGSELESLVFMGPPFGIRELSIETPGIHRIVLDGSGGLGLNDVYWDNLTFNPLVAAPEPVSGPAALAVLLAFGLRAQGQRLRTRRTSGRSP